MIIEKVDIKEVKMNKNNPRVIKDEKFKKLVKSIKEFPEMLVKTKKDKKELSILDLY